MVLGREQQQLGADEVGRRILDLRAEEDDALLQEALVDLAAVIEFNGHTPNATGTT